MRIGMDLDGPNLDFAANYYDGCITRLRHPLPTPLPPVSDWDFYKAAGQSTAMFLENCHLLADMGHLFSADPLPGAVDAWRRLVDAGHTIHIGTDRSFGRIGAPGQASRDATVKWLLRHRFPFHSITFTADKTELDVDVWVEDKPENFHALWDAGTVCYLVDKTWNRHVETLHHRVADVGEFADRVIALGDVEFVNNTVGVARRIAS